MIIKKLNEGTWSLSKGFHQRQEDGKKFIVKIEKLKKEIYPIFGDDSLFDEFDGAIARIEELMELPEDQIKESVVDDDEEIFEFNLRMKDIRKIIVLIFSGEGANMDDKLFLKSINISIMEQPSNPITGGGKYILVSSDKTPFEIKIWEDGFVALENGMDVKSKFKNALDVYDTLLKRMK